MNYDQDYENLATFDEAGFVSVYRHFNSSPSGQNGRHIADEIFRCISLNETFCILIGISLKFVHKGPIDIKWALVQAMAWALGAE